MRQDQKATFFLEQIDRVKRWWWVLVVGPCFGLGAGIVAYEYLPKTYEATTRILVSPPQIDQEFVRSTVTDDMSLRLQSLHEAVLSRPYMQKLMQEVFGVPENQVAREKLMAKIRRRLETRVTSADYRRGGGLFELMYRDEDPQRAARVVNLLAQTYISENIRMRTEQVESTTDTLQLLADEALSRLRTKETEIAEFKRLHLYELNEHLGANLQLLSGRRADLEANTRQSRILEDRLQTLRAQKEQALLISAETGTTIEETAVDPTMARIATLQRELQALLTRYTKDHPTVRATRTQLDDLIASRASSTVGSTESDAATTSATQAPLTSFDIEMRATEREIARLRQERRRVEQDLELYQRRVENTPQVEQQLAELTKGYDILDSQYREYQEKVEAARGSLRVEQTRKGERFEVVEEAMPTAIPASPNRVKLYLAAIVAGFGLFVLPVVLKGIISPRVVSEAGLRGMIEVPLLVSINEVASNRLRKTRRARALWNVAASVAALAALSALINVFHA
ncbi:MAG: hypothetical protein JSV80_09075 [Acidobacteriota bacterium]|nr:MAG: hypothetical protein JSV80_09075 [Acidobacteriota bacterium]